MSDGSPMIGSCPHGFDSGYRGYERLMAAPYATCRCCGTTYCYIDSAMYGTSYSKGRSHTPNLCDDCGGKYTEWERGTRPVGASGGTKPDKAEDAK